MIWTGKIVFDTIQQAQKFVENITPNTICNNDKVRIGLYEFNGDFEELRQISIWEKGTNKVLVITLDTNDLKKLIKEVKPFSNSAHVILPKSLLGRKVLIIPL